MNANILLIVDAQVGVLRNTWDASRVVENISLAVEKAREQGIPVIWVQHTDDELVSGSPDWQIVPELSPAQGEVQILKQFNSSFEQTSLQETLAGLGATGIVLAGAATNWCIRATAYGALERGYDLTLISDAHTTESIDLGDGERIKAVDIVRELNVVMTWVSYPDRTNRAVSVKDLDFSRLNN